MSLLFNCRTGTVFIADDGYLISNYHVVKDAAKVCLLTGLRHDEVASATQAGADVVKSAQDAAVLVLVY